MLDFGIESAAALHQVGQALRISEIDFIDNGQHRNFKQDGVQPGALNDDVNFTGQIGCDLNVFFIQAKQAQKVDKVAFDKPK